MEDEFPPGAFPPAFLLTPVQTDPTQLKSGIENITWVLILHSKLKLNNSLIINMQNFKKVSKNTVVQNGLNIKEKN